MKKLIFSILALAVFLLFTSLSLSPKTVSGDQFQWETDWDSARKLAKKQKKPLLVVFR